MNNYLLTFITWLPAVGAILILALMKKDQSSLIKRFATAWFGLDFLLSLWLLKYNRGMGGMQFLEDHEWIPIIGARYQMGVDGVAVLLIVLTTLLGAIAALSSWEYIQKREKEYYVLLLLLQTAVIGVFASVDLFLFYLFFEVSLVPMYFLIGIWGGENRLYAAIKFFLYTLVGSVVMLLGVLKMYFLTQDPTVVGKITQESIRFVAGNDGAAQLVVNTYQTAVANGTGTFNIFFMHAMGPLIPTGTLQILLFVAFALAFAIKVPMFPFHTWLPDAHVEAPTAGSVILAGVLLKMGTYGFLRFCLPLFPQASLHWAPWLFTLSIIGIIYGAWVSTVQTDIKKLVAYSSVSHLGFVVLGLFTLTPQGMVGGIIQMVNHGLSTGALFLMVGMIYERRHTRLIADFGGLWKVIPAFSVLFLIVCLSSLGLPGLNGFVGEFLILLGTFQVHRVAAVVANAGIIFAAVYLLWMYQRVCFGEVTSEANRRLRDLSPREWAVLLPVLLFIVWIGVYPTTFTTMTEPSVRALITQVQTKAQATSALLVPR